MTGLQTKNQKVKVGAVSSERWFVVNMVLIALFVIMLFVYVMQMNGITAGNYKIKVLNDKISSLNETHGILMANKVAVENPELILQYAKTNSMIEAGSPVAMYAENDFALKR
jgi:cell division protein FtsL